jgi:hypothetical protein
VQESERLAIEILPVLGEPATSVEPGDGSFDDPSFGQHDEGVQFAALDDLDDPVAALGSHLCGMRSLIARICKDTHNEREQGSRAFGEHESRAIAILDVGGMNGGAQQKAERVYEKMALLAFDLLSRIVPMRIVRPPFSALFTLWLSMMAAVGLAWRPPCSLHTT